MSEYALYNKEKLELLKRELDKQYTEYASKGLKLDMSRGKPGADQLDISNKLLSEINENSNFRSSDGIDSRNYGDFDGIPECKKIFSDIFEVPEKNVFIGGTSSLNLMFDYISQCMTHGAGSLPWCKQGTVKFACPVPGYDRHFGILEYFGIEMINVPMLDDGPDMDVLEELIKDSSVKGMFCVPKYSNPEGKTFSDSVVRRIAAMKPAAKDFRIIWDNAYCLHDLNDKTDKLLNIFDECKKYGNEDMVVSVVSTSKVSFPGAGVAAIAASDNNIAAIKARLSKQTICNDKINQLRHARYFGSLDGIKEHMKLHAEILRPKFNTVLSIFSKELSDTGIAEWGKPNGGYFISLNVMNGCAKRVVELCKNAGVVLTPAGATFPYGKDPDDKNIRVAPTFPPIDELETAANLLCLCVKLTAVEKLLSEK